MMLSVMNSKIRTLLWAMERYTEDTYYWTMIMNFAGCLTEDEMLRVWQRWRVKKLCKQLDDIMEEIKCLEGLYDCLEGWCDHE